MYYPFIRGKQFELLLLREMAPKIAEWGFVPIIEPVKESFPALKRALQALVQSNSSFILIANPCVGELRQDSSSLWDEIIDDQLRNYDKYSVGFNLTANDTLDSARHFFRQHSLPIAVIHCGFTDGKGLASVISDRNPIITEHVFVEQDNILYRKHFKGKKRVLVQDGFKIRTNRDYPAAEEFSELYLTYQDRGCDAFGDFLIVGSDFKEGGGPAYAIAIHLTYVDSVADDIIAIKHYVSDKVDTPQDPAGKYLEALEKLASDVRAPHSPILQTRAVKEYLTLYEDQHFPGLGYTKKLSMQHHLELMAYLLVEAA